MKTIDVDKLQRDPLSAAIAGTDKETVTVSGFICAVDKATISVCETRDSASYIEYPRSAVIAAFTDEESDQVTLLVDADARVKAISAARAGALNAQARAVGGTDCGTTCKSRDGSATCCCGVGQRCRSLLNTCICEDASRPLFPAGPGVFDPMSQTGAAEPGFAPPQDAPSQTAFRSRMGGIRGFGGLGGFGTTLPTCRWEKRLVVCGSALPGYPVPMCWEWVYCCTWPNGATSCV